MIANRRNLKAVLRGLLMADWPYNTRAWQRLRLLKLATDPLCYACSLRGTLTPGRAVDHIKAIKAGGAPFPALDGLMTLCERCHNEKTNAVDRPDRVSNGRRFKGFAADGSPIDPGDAWHGGGGLQSRERLGGRTDWKVTNILSFRHLSHRKADRKWH